MIDYICYRLDPRKMWAHLSKADASQRNTTPLRYFDTPSEGGRGGSAVPDSQLECRVCFFELLLNGLLDFDIVLGDQID